MSRAARISVLAFVVAGLVVAVVLAFFVSPHASSEPDGLEKVAIEKGFIDEGRDSATADLPTADYAVEGVDDEGLSTGLAGIIGVAVTFGVCAGLVLVARRHSTTRAAPPGT